MWRSVFIAMGIMAIILGFEFLVIESATFYSGGGGASPQTTMINFFDPSGRPAPGTRDWYPKEWMPWATLFFGAVVIVYAFTLPRRFGKSCPACGS